ncbi:hypothetical protein G6F56_003319 [Rhizopus delemar]|nr:hypothetical protein G6F56_003319 [Rhizopus delemar]
MPSLQVTTYSHSLTTCPLETYCVFITDHTSQQILMATDEILNLLGYSMTDLFLQPITRHLKLLSRMTLIPECSIKHANGYSIRFEFSIHRELHNPNLDYWILNPTSRLQELMTPSLISLNIYATIERVQNLHFKQTTEELSRHQIMTFVYNHDLPALFRCLSRALKHDPEDPVFLRWSRTYSMCSQPSTSYDWMYFMFVASHGRPLVIARPLHCPCLDQAEKRSELYHTYCYVREYIQSTQSHVKEHLGSTQKILRDCLERSKLYIEITKTTIKEYTVTSKTYLKEYGQYLVSYLLDQDNSIGHFIKTNRLTKKSVGLLQFINLLLE